MNAKILIVEDETHIAEVIIFALTKEGFEPVHAKDAAQALDLFFRQEIDLIVLDVGLPDVDGFELCRDIRKSSDTPILFLSARNDEIDRIIGLELGGDDYLSKPFSPRELVARIKAILKRTNTKSVEIEPLEYQWNDLVFSVEDMRVTFCEQAIPLTRNELEMLKIFMARKESILDRQALIVGMYGADFEVSDRTIDSHIRNLRAKFASIGGDDIVETVHGVGFRLGKCIGSV